MIAGLVAVLQLQVPLLLFSAFMPVPQEPQVAFDRTPELIPGGGWGAIEQEVIYPGAFQDAQAIAHFDRMPEQILWRDFDIDFELGVLAYHRSGVERVDFAVEGGPVVGVERMTTNTGTGYHAYTVRLAADRFTPGESYEVIARVIPVHTDLSTGGKERVLRWRFHHGGGLDQPGTFGEVWVAADGDDGGPGSEGQPFATVAHALNVVGSINGGEAGVIHLLGDKWVTHGVEGVVNRIHNQFPITIKRDVGNECWFAPRDPMNVRHLLLTELQIDYSFDEMFSSSVSDAKLFFKDVEFRGVSNPRGRGFPREVELIAPWTDYGRPQNGVYDIYVADSVVFNVDGYALGLVRWVRGTTLRWTSLYALRGTQALIDCDVVDARGPSWYYGNGTNLLIDGLTVRGSSGSFSNPGLSLEGGADGLAIVNCVIDARPESGRIYFGSYPYSTRSYHTLFLNNTLINTSISFLNPGPDGNPFYGGPYFSNSLFSGVILSSGFFDEAAIATGWPGTTNLFEGMLIDADNLHILDPTTALPAWANWSEGTLTSTFIDADGGDYRVRASSPASSRIGPNMRPVDFDSDSVRRGDRFGNTATGALRGEDE